MPRSSQRLSKKKQTPKKKETEKKEEKVAEEKQDQDKKDQVKPQEKTKQIVKAKKYKQKSYDENLRIQKSKHERIFLLSANREEQHWRFMVQGTTGSQYHVNISTVVYCTCMDYRFKKIPCKHIYFIVTQVGQNDQLLDYFKKDRRISKNAYTLLDEQLTSRLKSRMEKPAKDAKDIDLKDETDCVICFTQMDKETEALEDCSTCKKYFHTQCIAAWKAHNPSCPLCRGSLAGSGSGADGDPLGKLVGIKL